MACMSAEYYREYRRKHRTKTLRQHHRYDNKPEVKERRRAYMRSYYARNKQHIRARKAAFAAANPHVIRAQQAVKDAIKAGKLTRQPCEVCGEARSQGHHWDYDRPLDVIWLCKKHHEDEHRTWV